MSAAKNKEPSSPKPADKVFVFLGWLVWGPPRGLTWSCIALAAFAAISFGLWRHIAPRVLTGRDYQLGPRDFEITPPPSWVRSDLTGDVVRSLSLDASLSLLDDDLTERIYKAFAAQAWVAKVDRVAKQHPARVRVDLVYRRPVCMVEAAGTPLPGSSQQTPQRLLPVDVTGVLLPERDFNDADRQRYPRLTGIPSAPPSMAGNRWSDARVLGGAQIASALVEVWKDLSLERIVASKKADTSLGSEDYTYEIFTIGGTRIQWGYAPNAKIAGEVPVADKISRLKKMLKEQGTLDGPQIIDLRYWHHARVIPLPTRSAALPEEDSTLK